MPIVYNHKTICPKKIKEMKGENKATEEFLQACVDNWPSPEREKEITEIAHQKISDLIQSVQKMKEENKTKKISYDTIKAKMKEKSVRRASRIPIKINKNHSSTSSSTSSSKG